MIPRTVTADFLHFAAGRCRLVLACGCFDLLHPGHVRHLTAARRLGDALAVLLTPDAHVGKGPGRPVFPEAQRAEMLLSLRCVDHVAINTGPDAATAAVNAINLIRPAVYVKGSEYRGKESPSLLAQIEAVRGCGGEFVYTEEDELHTTDVVRWILGLSRNGPPGLKKVSV